MKKASFAVLPCFAIACLAAGAASALTVDNSSMNRPGDATRFSDPDEQAPIQWGAGAGMEGTAAGNTDPSSVRYDYDARTGSFTPHKN